MDALRSGTYEVRTYGCQMNVHDSERMAGLLEDLGLAPVVEGVADVVVLNTCAVRENADNKLYGNLGHLASVKRENPGMLIAVGGCLAQKDQQQVLDRAPWVDVVFGTHNVASLPQLLERARVTQQAQVEFAETLQQFPSDLPRPGARSRSAWVAISVGCNNTCTFCIVPSLRGREVDRSQTEIIAEIKDLVAAGVVEVTLLGQNVNAYGSTAGDPGAFARLLRSCGEVPGLRRVRFTSPHPKDFSPDVISAMATTHNVMPSLHMPLQSGSDAVLARMRRSYRQRRFLDILAAVREELPHAAITTDIIVGFPGETEADFAQTLQVVEQARFAAAFTFQYSPRPGTPAATMPDQVPAAVVAERYARLVAAVDAIAWQENQGLVGTQVEVLISGAAGRKDAANHRVTGRACDNRLVHLSGDVDGLAAGDLVPVRVTGAAPHHLLGVVAGTPDPAPPLATDSNSLGSAGSSSCGSTPGSASTQGSNTVNLGMPVMPLP